MAENRSSKLKRLIHLKNSALVADRCILANTFLSRAVGLLGRGEISDGEAMLLMPCNSIHMWFMRFPIDVVFLKHLGKGQFQVTSTHRRVPLWKLLPLRDAEADDTLEMPSGTLEKYQIQVGDTLCLN